MPKNLGIEDRVNNSSRNFTSAHETSNKRTEEWKPIPDYEGLYMVSNFGRILNVRTGVFVCQYNKGRHLYYKKVELWKDKKMKRYPVHRLVALAFIPNPNDYPQINHIDENPQNNYIENLEWCDARHNTNHGKRNIKSSTSNCNAVGLYSESGELLDIFRSTRQAAFEMGMSAERVKRICQGVAELKGNYTLRYLNYRKRI